MSSGCAPLLMAPTALAASRDGGAGAVAFPDVGALPMASAGGGAGRAMSVEP